MMYSFLRTDTTIHIPTIVSPCIWHVSERETERERELPAKRIQACTTQDRKEGKKE